MKQLISLLLLILLVFSGCDSDDDNCSEISQVEITELLSDNISVESFKQTLEWSDGTTNKRFPAGIITTTLLEPVNVKFEIVNAINFELNSIIVEGIDAVNGDDIQLGEPVELSGNFKELNSLLNTYVFAYDGKVLNRNCDFLLQLKYTFESGGEEEILKFEIIKQL